jgi:hypothetical protein
VLAAQRPFLLPAGFHPAGPVKGIGDLRQGRLGEAPSQGECTRRSCTTALAHGIAWWLTGAERGQVVGIMAFNLSAAFDTVAAKQLLPKLQLPGVSGRALAWFKSYLTGGS